MSLIPYRRRIGDSPDNANRDHDRQRRWALADLEDRLRRGLISQGEYDAMRSVHDA